MIGLRVGIVLTSLALSATVYCGYLLGLAPSLASYVATICSTSSQQPTPEEAQFVADNAKAMKKMMADMEIRPTGNVDNDFVAMMVPHHSGAIEMAEAELRYGRNEQLRRIAQEIIVTQQQEIAAMRLAIGQRQPSGPTPDQSSSRERTYAKSVVQNPLD